MSESDRYKNKGMMWAITAVVVVLSVLVCGIAIFYNRTSVPTMNPSSDPSSSSSTSSEPPEPSSSSEPEEEPEPASSSKPEPSQPPSGNPSSNPVPTPAMVHIDEPGTFSTPSTYQQLVINSPDVILKNKTITGNLFIMDQVGDGDVTLENVIVEGILYIYGGGANTVTLRDVWAKKVLLQKDGGTLGVLATGECHLEEVTIKCDAVLTEESLQNGSAGFDVVYVNEGAKSHYDISLRNVSLKDLFVNSNATVNLNNQSSISQATAQAPLRFTGSGRVESLTVRSNEVSYENAPGRVHVENGYNDPTHGGESASSSSSSSSSHSSSSSSRPKKDWDEGGSFTNGPTKSTVRLSMPRDLTISYNSETGAFVANFSPVSRSSGYVVTPYLKRSGGLAEALTPIHLSGENSTTATVLPDAQNYLGQELRYKVYALGDEAERTTDSEEATTAYTLISQLPAPIGLTATFNRDADGYNTRFELQWTKQTGVRGYSITVEDKTGGSTQTIFSETETYSFSFDRGEPKEKHFIFTVTALSAKDTVRIDSKPSEPVTGKITVLADPTQVALKNVDGKVVASWEYPSSPAPHSFRLFVMEDGNVVSTKTVEASLRECVLYENASDPALSAKSIRFKVGAVASSGYADSLDVLSNSITLEGALPAPDSVQMNYRPAGNSTVAGYYATWSPVPGSTAYQITPVVGGLDRAPVVVKSDVNSLLILEKRDFKEGVPVSYRIRALSNTPGLHSDTEGICKTPRTPRKLTSPDGTGLILNISQTGDLSASFPVPAGNPATTSYQLTVHRKGDDLPVEAGGKAVGGTVNLPFTLGDASPLGEVPTYEVHATDPNSDWIDSEPSSISSQVVDNRITLSSRLADSVGDYYVLKLPTGYSGSFLLTILDITDPTNTAVLYDGYGKLLNLTADKPFEFIWRGAPNLQGKKLRISLVLSGEGAVPYSIGPSDLTL